MREGTALEFAPETRQRWEWSPEDIRRFGHLVVDLIAHHLTSLPERPVFRPFPPELAARFLGAAVPWPARDPRRFSPNSPGTLSRIPLATGIRGVMGGSTHPHRSRAP